MTEPESREYLVSKEGAAHAQLETAIWLWVTRDDPVSIHTLAASSNEILHALGSKIVQPSIHREWLKEQPKRIQKLVFEHHPHMRPVDDNETAAQYEMKQYVKLSGHLSDEDVRFIRMALEGRAVEPGKH